jgi:hypothetical protein
MGVAAAWVKSASSAKTTARVKAATSSHTEASAHMATAAPAASEGVGSSQRDNHRESRKEHGRGLQL